MFSGKGPNDYCIKIATYSQESHAGKKERDNSLFKREKS